MTETPSTSASSPDPKAEPTTEPVHTTPAATPPPAYAAAPVKERRRPSVTTVAAWVGIVAGVVFIVAVVFFSGFVLGRSSGGDHHRDRGPGQGMMYHRDGPQPGMFPMGPRGQFEHPVMPFGPGMQRGGQPGEPASPSTTAPARP